MGGYRPERAASCRPMPTARLKLAEAVGDSLLMRFLQGFFRLLYTMPLRFYGWLGLFYGVFGILCYLILPFVYPPLSTGVGHLVVAVSSAVIALPLLIGSKRLCETVAGSRLGHAVVHGLLGVPTGAAEGSFGKPSGALPYLAFVLALGAAAGSLFLSASTLPIALLALIMGGMVFSYPETGVVLSAVALPIVWLWRGGLPVLAALLIFTWFSYGLKLLILHRTFRFGRMELAVLVFGIAVLLSGTFGASSGAEGLSQSAFLFLCISDYFLIVNLITTRAGIERCLVSLSTAMVAVTLASYLRLLPPNALDWLRGSRAGDAIIGIFKTVMESLTALPVDEVMFLLAFTFPLLLTGFRHAPHAFRRVWLAILLAAEVGIVTLTHSVVAGLCMVAGTLIYLLITDSRALAGLAVAALPIACGVMWLQALIAPYLAEATRDLALARMIRESLRAPLWETAAAYPGGVGIGVVGDSGNLLLEILHNFGWQGLLPGLLVLFLLCQKGFSAVNRVLRGGDATLILAVIAGIVVLLLYGASTPLITTPQILLAVTVMFGLAGSYANILFNEHDILLAESACNERGDDRILRRW